MIEVRGLTKHYGRTVAVDDLSFEVRPGAVTGFLGPNGAGKSTTMRMVLELDRPTSGAATVNGRPYASLEHPLREVGSVLDAKQLHPRRTGRNHLRWLASSNGIPNRRVDEVLDLVGLTEAARRNAGSYSLGMSQRLGLAAALLGDPPILMFDEPVNGLDPDGILWIRHMMQRLAAEGRTVFVSSHLLSEMALTASHLVVIGRGRLIADASTADFVQRSSQNYTRVRTTEPERLTAALREQGWTVNPDDAGSLRVERVDTDTVGRLAGTHGIVLLELSEQRASLEQAFMELTAPAVEFHGSEAKS